MGGPSLSEMMVGAIIDSAPTELMMTSGAGTPASKSTAHKGSPVGQYTKPSTRQETAGSRVLSSPIRASISVIRNDCRDNRRRPMASLGVTVSPVVVLRRQMTDLLDIGGGMLPQVSGRTAVFPQPALLFLTAAAWQTDPDPAHRCRTVMDEPWGRRRRWRQSADPWQPPPAMSGQRVDQGRVDKYPACVGGNTIERRHLK